jgi:uncharacterized protein
MVGRTKEIGLMNSFLESEESDLLVVTGRRRVGKTFLIRQVYQEHLVLDFTGTKNTEAANQLEKFRDKLAEYSSEFNDKIIPENWANAFKYLREYLENLRKSKKKKVIFLDEVPWIDSHKSGFLEELQYWWNNWAVNQNILVVLCGSATSYIVKKIFNDKGGLHNRVTKKIHLLPFTLAECQDMLVKKGINYSTYDLLQLYMMLGGIPFYIMQVEKGESPAQAVQRICFSVDGLLNAEFENLYAALFDNYENHVSVVKALASKWQGLTRSEIVKLSKFNDGGGLSRILNDLETCSFITKVPPLLNIKKDSIYRLTDEYSLFYFAFIEGRNSAANNNWLQRHTTEHVFKIWQGYAFENLCLKHVEAIKIALGISGMYTTTHSYFAKKTIESPGMQIDMIINRSDNVINLCEIKFYSDQVTVTEDMANTLRKRRSRFIELSGTKHTVFNTLISTFGHNKNPHSISQIDSEVVADSFLALKSFKKV